MAFQEVQVSPLVASTQVEQSSSQNYCGNAPWFLDGDFRVKGTTWRTAPDPMPTCMKTYDRA